MCNIKYIFFWPMTIKKHTEKNIKIHFLEEKNTVQKVNIFILLVIDEAVVRVYNFKGIPEEERK